MPTETPPALAVVKLPAYYTAAFDLTGALKIQQIQYRRVLTGDPDGPRELEMLPTELLHVENPTPQDVIAKTLGAALGDVAAGAAQQAAELQAQHEQMITDRDSALSKVETLTEKLAEAAAKQTKAEEERDAAVTEQQRLRVVVDALAPEDATPDVATQEGAETAMSQPEPPVK